MTIQSYLTKPQWREKFQVPFIQILLFMTAFLFAQAILFEATVPLFVPFYIACAVYENRYSRTVLYGGMLGALMLGVGHLLQIILQIFMYSLMRKIPLVGRHKIVALMVATAIVQVAWQLSFYAFQVPPVVQLYMLFEIVASGIVYVFFKQALVEPNRLFVDWRYERTISVIILFSFLLVALNEIQIFNIAPATLLLQFAICCAAFYGSVTFAAFIAIVISVTLSMSQLSFSGMIALYAVTGALVGNAKRLGKYGIALLSIVPSAIFVFYDATLPLDIVHFTSISLGALLFIQVATFIRPKKKEVVKEQSYVEQSLDDFRRFNVFLQEMVELSLVENLQRKVPLTDFTVCNQCYRYEQCWSQNIMEIKLKELLVARQTKQEAAVIKAEQQVQTACIRSVHLLNELQHRVMQFNIMNQQYYSRKLIGNQLKEMGQHFERLLERTAEIGAEKTLIEQRLQQQLGAECVQVQVDKLRFGYVTGSVSFVQEVDPQTLAQQLTRFFKEQMDVDSKVSEKAIISTVKYKFRSAIRYQMEYDVYNKTNAEISGDHVVMTEVESGLHALLVADGMGTGVLAREQSTQLLFLLRQCLQYQLSPELTLLTLQYFLNPITQDSYATLDMLLFDLKKGELIVWKTGSSATYVVRGDQLMVLESRSAPIGTLQEKTSAQTLQLLAGDCVIILTDGMFESEQYEEQERYLQQLILQNAQRGWTLATMLYEVMESYKAKYVVQDDVTFIATKIEHLQGSWATVKI
ncbi:MAG: SpoIIE family protein phosphatase [Lysinibacillus sp.]